MPHVSQLDQFVVVDCWFENCMVQERILDEMMEVGNVVLHDKMDEVVVAKMVVVTMVPKSDLMAVKISIRKHWFTLL